MIIPLYNLHAHNVLTNTIFDAGTDARVAKFHKRGLEILGLGVLEATEVWLDKEHAGLGAGLDVFGTAVQRTSSGQSSLAPPGQNPGGSRAATPEQAQAHSPVSSRRSLSSDGSHIPHPHPHPHAAADVPQIDIAIGPPATPTGAKKFFGRIFKKKETAGSTLSPSPGGLAEHRAASPTSPLPASPPPPPEKAQHQPSTPTKHATNEVLLPSVLGLSPLLLSATNTPTGRAVSYTWVVRKWLKVDAKGLISGVIGKIGREASAHGIGYKGEQNGGVWAVHFEWQRGKSKSERAKRHAKRRSTGVEYQGSRTPSRRSSTIISEQGHSHDAPVIMLDSPRQSLDAHVHTPTARRQRRISSPRRSISSLNHSDEGSCHENEQDHEQDHEHDHEHDEGEESDPEDSETPWTCYMVLTEPSPAAATPTIMSSFLKGHSHSPNPSTSLGPKSNLSVNIVVQPSTPTPSNPSFSNPPPPNTVKTKVATLSPAPHHPKVVCQLKVPFPLPDIEVENGALCKRVVLGDGSTRDTLSAQRGHAALTLTAEEIKDVVCSTAFWLVVREGIGGVGKVSRKGDGWKIRG
jgi:hypothetical protein